MATDAKRAFRGISLGVALVLLCGGCGLIGAVANTAAKVAVPVAGAKLKFACIPEGTLVDTPRGRTPIEAIRVGESVTGFDGEAVQVLQLHAYAEDPTVEFLAIEFSNGSRVDLCGMHRIDGTRAKHLVAGDRIGGLRILRVTRYVGVERSYDLLTEDAGYRIQGLPVNSMIEEMSAYSRTGELPAGN